MITSKLAGKEEALVILQHKSTHQLINCPTLVQFQLIIIIGTKTGKQVQLTTGKGKHLHTGKSQSFHQLIYLLSKPNRIIKELDQPMIQIKAEPSMASVLSH